jgi:hypothetical protein
MRNRAGAGVDTSVGAGVGADTPPRVSVVQCVSCHRAWTLEAWRALPATARLTAGDVRDYVVGWPASAVVEVRACEGCGRSIARFTRQGNAA